MADEKFQMTFMEARIVRLASYRWNLPVEKIIDLFRKVDVLGYIETGFGIFHCEGDETVLDDVEKYLIRKGVNLNG
ncbi:Protein of unknown function [Pseudobutyrivibrio sp. UC1225]|uniref:DUF3791 domain-containing protein n=1 Tax=Pseudobutyrivibrio sp. UC1225 TaxID=1798185 RepID=UPI0008F11788|nr:DUF3791 domain-containing protein [Pseudobutyrivibrio sp. UC1225]SFN91585.1 Protein of unknown function [Pseudobutyrivibrio sp. UC1225]